MNKLAIFVEGYTELVFADRLVGEIAGNKNVRIEWRRIRGGTSRRRTMQLIRAASPDTGQQYFVLVVDCGGDDAVKSRIVEEYDNLVKAGYQKIVGVRDVRPRSTRADIPKLERGLPRMVKTKPILVDFILAIMEIEAWFMAEHTHFVAIDTRLTAPFIQANLGFDPSVDDMQQRDQPADDLNSIYKLVGQAYQKRRSDRTVNAMDFGRVYVDLPPRNPYLQKLVNAIDAFLS
jgi:hypothetical protein